MLWKDLFYRHWKVDQSISMGPGKVSWVQEYKRLYYHTPAVESEVVRSHTDEVLHVSFAHNGKMFATCSKDGFVKIWNINSYPCSLKNQADMSSLKWKHTAFSQFNESDTLILVSGPLSTNAPGRGGIAIINLQGDFVILNEMVNTGFSMLGTWYNDRFFLSGDPNWSGHGVSSSHICLHKTPRVNDFKDEPSIAHLFRFRTENYSSIRHLIIANVFMDSCNTQDKCLIEHTAESRANQLENKQSKSTISMLGGQGQPDKGESGGSDDVSHICKETSDQEETNLNTVTSALKETFSCISASEISKESSTSSNNEPDKYLIFMCGSETDAPTHIGLKRFEAQDYFDVTTGKLLSNLTDFWHSLNSEAFDNIDHIFDMHGRIIGMCLSPDHRYLYVNSRKWKEVCEINDPMQLPPLAEEIDLHVLDLLQVKMVGKMNASHKAYSPSNSYFIIYLDVCEDYVASGAEDNHGHIWDRHYRICFNKFPHSAVVNSVAFNPADPEMLVTVSDDFSVKIWRSRFSEDNLVKTKIKLTECWKQEISQEENIG